MLAAPPRLYLNPDWIIPSWPAPAHVHAVCTTRAGGASQAPFDSMNLGDHVGDDLRHVAQNRALLRDAIHATPVFLTQVHGVHVVEHVVEHGQQAVEPSHKASHKPSQNEPDSDLERLGIHGRQGLQADACLTRRPGVACTIMVADCLPLLFTNRQGTVVGAAHAGWRGLAGEPGTAKSGVLEAIYQRFRALALVHIAQDATNSIVNQLPATSPGEKWEPALETLTSAAHDILVWLGPCIGPEKFEVGGEVRDAFLEPDASATAMFKPCGPGKWLADLAGLARLRLRAMGIENIYGNDGSPSWCTASNPSRFFSHRRDTRAVGGSGRMAACIWLG